MEGKMLSRKKGKQKADKRSLLFEIIPTEMEKRNAAFKKAA
jgi:hypothetical protein